MWMNFFFFFWIVCFILILVKMLEIMFGFAIYLFKVGMVFINLISVVVLVIL